MRLTSEPTTVRAESAAAAASTDSALSRRSGILVNPPEFLGPAEFQGQDVLTWQLGQGILVLPNAASPFQKAGMQRSGLVQQFTLTNSDFRNAFPGGGFGELSPTAELAPKQGYEKVKPIAPPTVAQLIDCFGGANVGGGFTFKDAVSILPPALQFSSPQALAAAIAEREGAALRSDATTTALITSALGLDPRTGSIAQASTTNLLNVTTQVKKALVAGGLDTVSKVANASAQAVTALLQKADVPNPQAEAARLNGLTLTLINVG